MTLDGVWSPSSILVTAIIAVIVVVIVWQALRVDYCKADKQIKVLQDQKRIAGTLEQREGKKWRRLSE